MRKLGIPPARIPEITWRKPSGITAHIATSKQTTTKPCRNESGEVKRTVRHECVFGLSGCVCVLSVTFGVVWLFAVFLQWNPDGGWQVPYLFAFCDPQPDGGYMCALIS